MGLEVHTHLPAIENLVNRTMNTVDSIKNSQIRKDYKDSQVETDNSFTNSKVYKDMYIQTDSVDSISDVSLSLVNSQEHSKLESSQEDVVYSVDNISSTSSTDDDKPSLNSSKPKQVYVWTAEWILKRLKEEVELKEELALALLRTWVHPKRQIEASYATIHRLISLPEIEAVQILYEFTMPPRYIRGVKGNQLDVNLTATALDTLQSFSVKALLDTGCTGSAIDAGLVKEHNLNTKKLPVPIPVYNADGSHNSGGPIHEYVELIVDGITVNLHGIFRISMQFNLPHMHSNYFSIFSYIFDAPLRPDTLHVVSAGNFL